MIKIKLPNGITIESYDKSEESIINKLTKNIDPKNIVTKIKKVTKPDASPDFYKGKKSFAELLEAAKNTVKKK